MGYFVTVLLLKKIRGICIIRVPFLSGLKKYLVTKWQFLFVGSPEDAPADALDTPLETTPAFAISDHLEDGSHTIIDLSFRQQDVAPGGYEADPLGYLNG